MGLIIGVVAGMTTLASSSIVMTSAYASSEEAPCSPPVEDPNSEGNSIERCAGKTCSIDDETGERVGCASETGGLLKIEPENEYCEERFLHCGVVTTP